MKKLLALILSAAILLPPAATFANTGANDEASEKFVVFLKENQNPDFLIKHGAKQLDVFETINAVAVEMKPGKLSALVDYGLVKNAAQNRKVKISGIPAQTTPWSHTAIKMSSKNPADLTGKGVKIAVIDSGIAPHPDLVIKGGTCVMSPAECNGSYYDENGHGTHVAGIIAAQDNGIGVVGVAPGAEVYAVKALNAKGEGSSITITAGIEWAMKNNMDIVNMSFTTPFDDPAMEQVIDKATAQGIIFVGAAGNNGNQYGMGDIVQYPAKFANVIAVSSVSKYNTRADTSATGKEIELAAPGVDIISTFPTNLNEIGLANYSGTSMAAPLVAGMAALYKEKYPSYSNTQIRSLLQKNARDLGTPGRDYFYGYGIVQVDTATPPPPVITIPYKADASGKINLDLQKVVETYGAYNIYRFDQRIKEKATALALTDYGMKGSVEYMVYPIENGVENRNKAISVKADVGSPTVADVSNSNWYSRYMVYLNSQGILYGYENNLYKPSQYVKRAEAVAMIGRALGLDGTQRTTRFTDVGMKNGASGYIEAAAEKGIISGRTDGTFRPYDPVTRAEMAIMISKAFSLPTSNTVAFSDVNEKVTGYQYIYNLAGSKITTGYSDGTFRPYEKMLRSTYAAFLAKADEPEMK